MSPGPQRSESSSDISVLSNPSESSIEVLEPSSERQPPNVVYQENLSSRLQESLNSSKLTSSEDSQTTGCSENTTVFSEGSSSMVQSDGAGIYSEGTLDSEGTMVQQDWEGRATHKEDGLSTPRLGSKGEDVSSMEGEADNTFHSCRSENISIFWKTLPESANKVLVAVFYVTVTEVFDLHAPSRPSKFKGSLFVILPPSRHIKTRFFIITN